MEYKQIILIRTDTEMRKGKMCVQVAHASLLGSDASPEDTRRLWKREGMRKIVLKVKSLEQLFEIWDETVKNGICGSIVKDFGLTQVEPDTITAVGFAPYKCDSTEGKILENLTKDLSLL